MLSVVYLAGWMLFFYFSGKGLKEAIEFLSRHIPVLFGFVLGYMIVELARKKDKVSLKEGLLDKKQRNE